jgi:hypothetical protein
MSESIKYKFYFEDVRLSEPLYAMAVLGIWAKSIGGQNQNTPALSYEPRGGICTVAPLGLPSIHKSRLRGIKILFWKGVSDDQSQR